MSAEFDPEECGHWRTETDKKTIEMHTGAYIKIRFHWCQDCGKMLEMNPWTNTLYAIKPQEE